MPLHGSLVIGRGAGADVSLDDPRVSARHTRIALDAGHGGGESRPGGIIVEDLGSSNGTFVNDMAVTRPTWLACGDELLVGVTVLTVHGHAGAVAGGPSSV
jgi:pSer/pThr/pTyr-binding forkhead associated (FHA) protein